IRYFEELHGSKAAEKQRDLQLRLNYQIAMMLGAEDRPVDLPTSAFNDVFEYAAIVYGKGALFFGAMREHLGPDVYDEVIRAYYADYMFGIAGPDDLVERFAKASKRPEATRALAKRWLNETHGKKDIGPIRLGRLLRQLLGEGVELPIGDDILRLLDHDGFVEITRILTDSLSGETNGDPDPIDLGAIFGLLGEVTGANRELGQELDDILKPLSPGGDGQPVISPDLMRELERELDRADPQAREMFDAMKEMFQAPE
ncbi:MAG: hypothetical protein VX938_04395, partial [Myxococcota bacterium]|nr:hypothetical protein [Myxococcota bacterium]